MLLPTMDTEELCDRGIALNAAGRFAEAMQCFTEALALRPDFTDARYNLGNSYVHLGRLDEAIECYRAVLVRAPRSADTHSSLGAALQERGRLDDAQSAYERAIELEPSNAEALSNFATLLEELGRRRDAFVLYQRALEANPASARTAYNLGLAYLREQQFELGWRYCEARFDTRPPVTPRRTFPVPELSAADLGRGHRVAVWREQGLGDQILYSTLLPELEARGHALALEVDPRLEPAYRRAHPGWISDLGGCDRHIALGSLPRLLRPDVASFSGQPAALLSADAARYRSALGSGVVGISWRSFQKGLRRQTRASKSAPLEAFAPLSRRRRLLDLQYGDTSAERAAFTGRLERLPDLDLFDDLDGVLAAIAACDAIVTTSNVTAHFAGALGKPTWLAHTGRDTPFWYWVPGADGCSLWYPSVRIVSSADWESALAAVPF